MMANTYNYSLKDGNISQVSETGIAQYLTNRDLIPAEKAQEVDDMHQNLSQSYLKVGFNFGFLIRKNYYKKLKEDGFKIENIRSVETDKEVLEKIDIHYLLNNLFLPLRIQDNELIVAAADPFNDKFDELATMYGLDIQVILAEDLDIVWMIHKYKGDEYVKKAVFDLYDKNPNESAIVNFTKRQLVWIFIIAVSLLGGLIFYTFPTLLTINVVLSFLFLIMIVFKLFLSIMGAQVELDEKVTKQEVDALDEQTLPPYTILLPVYKESEVLRKLVGNLLNLDYPKHLLDIKLLLEEDDDLTLDTVRNLDFPAVFDTIIVPFQMPKTKPKACNYGLFFSRGKYITIYDAEDVPDSDQLKKAVVLFNKLPNEYMCIQCALNYFNRNENTLTRMFTLEYSYWFDYALQGLDALKIPIPLGGTSNHFKSDILNKLGAWDPFNVTEDADLGTRAYAEGYKVALLNSTTYEEANTNYKNWIRQRSRWIKGYMQTYLVYMRDPIKLYKELGFKGFFGFHFFIGGTSLTFLLYIVLLFIMILSYVVGQDKLAAFYPNNVMILCTFNFVVGNILIIYINMMAVFKRSLYDLLVFSILNPLYWIMHSISAYKGLWQLINNPFYWEKTNHGLTKEK
ncbi:MAG: hypothetical protein RL662_514 [Bacteroidota bacterium]|jgi:cellulose synthase/poly-beta-1,6-N-acetylglucosamine synthase-like glycosyltransferase